MGKRVLTLIFLLILIFGCAFNINSNIFAEENNQDNTNYLCFTCVEYQSPYDPEPISEGYIVIEANKITPTFTIQYKVNEGEWYDYTFWEHINLKLGDKVYFRNTSEETTTFSTSYGNYYHFNSSCYVEASGDITTLINKNGTKDLGSNNVFTLLFSYWTKLLTSPELPATELTNECYGQMFRNCTYLKNFPDLPATVLKDHCYADMFLSCSSVEEPMEILPATELAKSCYIEMFYFCTSLKHAPKLPATELTVDCYWGMFRSCYSLEAAPELPATIAVQGCYASMFEYCTSIVESPKLPSKDLAYKCYDSMFSHCTNLKVAPVLPATTLAESCYENMFSYCENLTEAPYLPAKNIEKNCYNCMFAFCTNLKKTQDSLPALSLAENCYYYMYRDCINLEKAPDLPATTLADNCYRAMFLNCSKLKKAPQLPATELTVCCYYEMFNGCSSLEKAPDLPATKLSLMCYCGMFANCDSLTEAPDLPALILVDGCYSDMFMDCNGLVKAPDLPAQILTSSCYSRMFSNCTSLEIPPIISATTFSEMCCYEMFSNCSNLKYAPELNMTVAQAMCCNSMFKYCTNLLVASDITVPILEDYANFSEMYKGCTKLVKPSNIYINSISSYAFYGANNIFTDCSNIYISNVLDETYTIPYTIPYEGVLSYDGSLYDNFSGMFENCGDSIFAHYSGGGGTPNDDDHDGVVTLYLKPHNVYTIYNGNGCTSGNILVELDTHAYGSDITVLDNSNNLKKDNYIFKGWNTKADGTGTTYMPGDTIPAINNIYLYVNWGQYVFTKGQNQTYQKKSYSNLKFVCDGPLDEFESLKIDGKTVNKKNYTISSGSTKITLNGSYLDKLKLGEHSIELIYNNGQNPITNFNVTDGDTCDYLNFTSLEDGSSVKLTSNILESDPLLLEYRVNNNYWDDYTFNTVINLDNDDVVYFRNESETTTCFNTVDSYHQFIMTGKLKGDGDITTLINKNSTDVLCGDECFIELFKDCNSLIYSPNLPATSLTNGCYKNMFKSCTNLKILPDLPATVLKDYCYYGMFDGCTTINVSNELNDDYCIPYYIPSGDLNLSSPINLCSIESMFMSTGGPSSFTVNGTPNYSAGDSKIVVYLKAIRVRYHANNGTSDVLLDENIYSFGDKTKVLNNTFSKNDQAFKKWNTSELGDGVSYNPKQKITLEDDVDLYAIWGDYEFLDSHKHKEYNKGSTKGIEFVTDGPLENFEVYLNENLLENTVQYKTIEKPTTIKLLGSYLKTLSVGEYTLKVVYSNGQVLTTKFVIKNSPIPDSYPYAIPKTGIK